MTGPRVKWHDAEEGLAYLEYAVRYPTRGSDLVLRLKPVSLLPISVQQLRYSTPSHALLIPSTPKAILVPSVSLVAESCLITVQHQTRSFSPNSTLFANHQEPHRNMAATFTAPQRKLTWLITGCSSGFGLALTRVVQAGGHKVIATSRDPSKTPDLVKEVESQGGTWLQLDVNDPRSPAFVENLEKSGHELDVLINNAGYSIFAPVESTAEDEIRAQMESLYFGPLRLIRAVLPHMRQRKFGVIANFSSGAALDGNPTMGAYAGAKSALDGKDIPNSSAWQ